MEAETMMSDKIPSVTDDMVLYFLLCKKENLSVEEKRIKHRLHKKLKWGHDISLAVDKECSSQGWYVCTRHHVEVGGTTKCWSECQVSELGNRQIPVLWRASIHNPRNWWKVDSFWRIPEALLALYGLLRVLEQIVSSILR